MVGAPSGRYHVLQYGGVGVNGLVPDGSAQTERVVHVGVGGGEPAGLEPAEEEKGEQELTSGGGEFFCRGLPEVLIKIIQI